VLDGLRLSAVNTPTSTSFNQEGPRSCRLPSTPEAVDWDATSDLICSILITVRDERESFQEAAIARAIGVEQLTAAAIAETVRQAIEGPSRRG